MKHETIEALIELGRLEDGEFDIEVLNILNNENIYLDFTNDGIRYHINEA